MPRSCSGREYAAENTVTETITREEVYFNYSIFNRPSAFGKNLENPRVLVPV
jgi:hypothetical protein